MSKMLITETNVYVFKNPQEGGLYKPTRDGQTIHLPGQELHRWWGWGSFCPPLPSDWWIDYQDLSLTTQIRFSNLTILDTHKQRTDKLCLVAVAKEFVALNDKRKGNFGTFRLLIRLKTQPLCVLGLASKSIHKILV